MDGGWPRLPTDSQVVHPVNTRSTQAAHPARVQREEVLASSSSNPSRLWLMNLTGPRLNNIQLVLKALQLSTSVVGQTLGGIDRLHHPAPIPNWP